MNALLRTVFVAALGGACVAWGLGSWTRRAATAPPGAWLADIAPPRFHAPESERPRFVPSPSALPLGPASAGPVSSSVPATSVAAAGSAGPVPSATLPAVMAPAASAPPSARAPGPAGPAVKTSIEKLSDAITELDVERARTLLAAESGSSEELAHQRARLAMVVGDCDAAEAVLRSIASQPDVQGLLETARNCARAVAGAAIVEDAEAGVWVRLQDEKDRALVPYIVDIVVPSRAALERDLGVVLPRPTRIELVRDLFSLSAMTGLPLEAAETTGTVGVARFGRVMMLSPRAPSLGYTWMDTLAHELTHVALSKGTRDYAPLWLQEGIAKRQETRWRKEQRFDDPGAAERLARTALLTGTSVGIDRIGRSIAMLPSAEMAAISYAEVTSFITHFIAVKGTPAFHLMLADLKGIGSKDPDAALRAVSGFGLQYWIAHWQQTLRASAPADAAARAGHADDADAALTLAEFSGRKARAQRLRLGHLLFWQGCLHGAVSELGPRADAARARAGEALDRDATMRFWRARALLGIGDEVAAKAALGDLPDVTRADAGWFALRGRFAQQDRNTVAAEQAFFQAVQANPLLEDVACEGKNRRLGPAENALPNEPKRRALCEAARDILRD